VTALAVAVVLSGLSLPVAAVGAGPASAVATSPTPLVQTSFVWGADTSGQVGNGQTEPAVTATSQLTAGGVVFSAFAAGGLDTVGLSTAGNLYAWGANTFGQLGNGTAGTPSSVAAPVAAPAGVTFTAIAAGSAHDLALSSTGTVYAWGANRFGQLGTGSLTDTSLPTAVAAPAGVTFTAIAAGGFDSYAISTTGAVYAWGANFYGQLGNGTTTASDSPVEVDTPAGLAFSDVATGGGHALAIASDGSVYAWGDNLAGQLGDGTNVDRPTPVAVDLPAGTVASQVAAGSADSIIVTTASRVLAWGSGLFGELGNGGTTDSNLPVFPNLPGSQQFAAVAAGSESMYALTANGAVWTWGSDMFGQMGDQRTSVTGQLSPEPLFLSGATSGTLVAGIFSGPDASVAALVTPATQTVSLAAIADQTYGSPPVPVVATATSGLRPTITASGGCAASGTRVFLLAVGTCRLSASQAGDLQFYPALGVTITFTIDPAPLTVTPFDTRATAGGPFPTFAYKVTGFKGGDTTAILSGSPSCTTPATSASPPGQYPITCTAGTLSAPNYVVVSGPAATLTLTASTAPTGPTAPTASVGGYAMVSADGSVWAEGPSTGPAVRYLGAMSGQPLNAPIVGAAFTPGASGYWLVASDGGIFSFGTAAFDGSMGGRPLNKPIVGVAAVPNGGGYWEVASDGGIFSFGDAQFYGSTGSMVLNKPIVGMTATRDGGGYWLVASDGGIFSFGDAQFYGSAGGTSAGLRIVGMASTPDGGGYWLATSNGNIYSYGDAAFEGSLRYLTLAQPVVSIAANPMGGGYWMTASDGAVFAFGGAPFYGRANSPPAPIVGII